MPATLRLLLLPLIFSAVSAARAADPVVVSLPGGVALTAGELSAEALRLPPPARAQVLSNPSETARFARNLLVRRELARRAEADGLQNEPKVAAELRASRERILAEAVLDRAEGEPPEQATLDRLARNQYDADPKKFETPEQVRVRHILVSAKACEAEARARELRDKARQPGADFAALAKANSDDPGSAGRGGDLGFFARGRMAPEFEAAAFALKQPGDLSDVVKTDFGFHVIRLEERKPAEQQPFEAVRDNLARSIAEREARSRRQVVVDQITAEVQFDSQALEAVVAGHAADAKLKQAPPRRGGR